MTIRFPASSKFLDPLRIGIKNGRTRMKHESKGANHVSRVPESGWPLPLLVVLIIDIL